MDKILLISYILILSAFIYKSKYFSIEGINKPIILFFFFLKLGAAFVYIQLHLNVLNGGDIETFIRESEILFSSFREDPRFFWQLTLGLNDFRPEPPHLMPYIDEMAYWYDQSNYLVVRINALIRLISFGNWNVNAIFFVFLSFVGLFGIFRFLSDYFHDNWQYILLIILFIIPSVIFWYSGIHKESIVIFSIGIVLNSYRNIKINRRKPISYFLILFGLLMMFLIRSYVFGAFVISFTALVLSRKISIKPVFVYLGTSVLYVSIAILIGQVKPSIDPLNEMIVRQQVFLEAEGRTTYEIPLLEKSLTSVVKNTPNAFLNIIQRPLIKDCQKSTFWCYIAMIESYIILFIILIGLWKLDWINIWNNSPVLFCLTFSLITLLIIGLIVNNAGALVRYKSIAIPFLLIGLILGRKGNNYSA